MATFDTKQQRMCVRIVYDGVASAGKTTNLRQLSEIFATQRTSELHSPQDMDGRTIYFDWLQIAAGMVSGFPLLCQVISVPGQEVFTPRRRHLLTTADAVVHVCDSQEHSATHARDGLGLWLVDEVARERGEAIPIVVQANKQDTVGALGGTALLGALGRAQVPVVEAIASEGIGVIDTFVAAVRGIVRNIQARVDSGNARIAVRVAETETALFNQLSEAAIDSDWTLETLLEEASNAFAVQMALDEPEVSRSHEAETQAPPIVSVSLSPPTPSKRESLRPPELPTEHVPTGFVWPAHTGRAALRALNAEPAMSEKLTFDPTGAVRVILGDFVLFTAREFRFETAEAARQALVRAARQRAQLGRLLAPETVLVAQPSGNDANWVWTVTPNMTSVAQLVSSRDTIAPRDGLLAAFGIALVDALKIEAQHGIPLDLSPASFGVRQGVIRYAGQFASPDRPPRNTASALLDAFVALATATDEVERALVSFESSLGARLTADEIAKLTRGWSWDSLAGLADGLPMAQERIEQAFRRGSAMTE